jgi:hypothetical protein
MKCSECSETVEDGAEICPNCGKPLSTSAQEPEDDKKYYCYDCNDELEYISTYEQWYCYTCLKYVADPKPAEAPEPSEVIAIKSELEEPESQEPVKSEAEIAWDEGVGISTDEDDSEISAEVEITDDLSTTADDSGEECTEAELSWDEAIELNEEVSESEIIINEDAQEDFDSEASEEIIMAGPIAGIDSGVDDIETVPIEEVELEIDEDSMSSDMAELTSEYIEAINDVELKKKAFDKLHQAWLKVNNLKSLNSDDNRISEIETELKSALEGKLDPGELIVLADESLEDSIKLEKELKEKIHKNISDLFHFVNSKILLAKKIGFNIENLEEELDNVTSLIAMGEYHQARHELNALLNKIYDLPKAQDEIMIGLEENSEIIQELLQPQAIKEA